MAIIRATDVALTTKSRQGGKTKQQQTRHTTNAVTRDGRPYYACKYLRYCKFVP